MLTITDAQLHSSGKPRVVVTIFVQVVTEERPRLTVILDQPRGNYVIVATDESNLTWVVSHFESLSEFSRFLVLTLMMSYSTTTDQSMQLIISTPALLLTYLGSPSRV